MLMPLIDLDACKTLTEAEKGIVAQTLNKGRLRASKPKKEDIYEHTGRYGTGKYRRNLKGEAAYVWRMLCFYLIAAHPHSCMPVTADWDVGDLTWEESKRRERCKELDAIVDKVLATIPTYRKAGLLRWSQALHGDLPHGISEVIPGISYAPTAG
jgi:hypothetical protein